MGQIEVYEFLKQQRSSGNEAFYTVSGIEKALKEKGYSNGVIQSARNSLIKLECYGYLETKMSGKVRDWKRLFRLKKKYVNSA